MRWPLLPCRCFSVRERCVWSLARRPSLSVQGPHRHTRRNEADLSPEQEQKNMFGLLFSTKAFVNSLTPKRLVARPRAGRA